MEKTKLRYEVPEAETFVVQFDGYLCQQSRDFTVGGASRNGKGYGNSMIFLDDDEED